MKKIALNYLILVSLALSISLQAESKVHYAKKTAKVAWHLSKMATASAIGIIIGPDLIQKCKESCMAGECTLYHTSDRILLPSMLLGSGALFVDGCLGLNEELEIVNNIKRLYKYTLTKKKK